MALFDYEFHGNERGQKITGTEGNDYLSWHPPVGEDRFAASLVGINGGGGDDLIEGSMQGYGQLHMRGGTGNDTFILDLSNTEIFKDGDYKGHQGHHVYGGPGRSIYNFTNIAQANGYVAGRIDDLDVSKDLLFIEGQALDLTNLPQTFRIGDMSVKVRIVDYQSPDMAAAGLASQQFLLIGDRIAYGLEGARQTTNPDGSTKISGSDVVEETHFIGWTDVLAMSQLPDATFVDQKNYVPTDLYDESTLTVISVDGPTADGTDGGDYIHADKQTTVSPDGLTIHPNNILTGGAGNDVINGGQGQDTIFGGDGDDLLAGGLDADTIDGGAGNDRIWGGSEADRLSGALGDDQLWGGDENDALLGGEGNDTLYGDAGDDVLNGGEGADTLNGGEGNDWVSYETATSQVSVSLSQFSQNRGEAAGDTFESIENIRGSSYGDALYGDSGSNIIAGMEGNDKLFGDEGNDALYGDAGDDVLNGGAGADALNGGEGNDWASYETATSRVTVFLDKSSQNRGEAAGDTFESIENIRGSAYGDALYGDSGRNIIIGFGGNDYIHGLDGNDYLYGFNGNDTLRGGRGADYLAGGNGNDRLFGDSGRDFLAGGLNDDTLYGGNSNDRLYGQDGDDTLDGGNHNDRLWGGDGNDVLIGNHGNDRLYGEAGRDTLDGGIGNDLIYGGADADVFVFADQFGTDALADFNPDEVGEVIDLSAVSAFVDFDDLVANHMSDSNAGVVIDDGKGNTITLTNVTVADLSADDFLFS